MFTEDDVVATPCPLCGESETRPVRDLSPFRVVRCRDCSLLYLSPRLDERRMLSTYEEATYFEGQGIGYSSYEAQQQTLRRTFARFLATLRDRGLTGGSLLEVGCAYGYFLDSARDCFDRRVGTDFSAEAVERARDVADEVHLGGLEAIPEGERFDVIAVIHVIEHIYDPVTFLRGLHERLRPGGAVVVATPDGGGFWRPVMGRRWPFYKPPEHVTFFDGKTLPRLLEVADFEPEPIGYPSFFPLHLIGEKLGVPVPKAFRHLTLPLPATTVAAVGRVPESP